MNSSRDDSAERTEPATPKKREQSRNKGAVARSVEMNSAFMIFFGLFLIQAVGSSIASEVATLSRMIFSHVGSIKISLETIREYTWSGVTTLSLLIFPIVFGFLLIGTVSNVAQVGLHMSSEALAPKWRKLNPLKGIKNLFISQRSLVEILKSLLKIVIVGWVAYLSISAMLEESVSLMDGDVAGIFAFLVRSTMTTGLKIGFSFLVLAVFDYFYQRFEHEKELRMTKEEVKEEIKGQEGDPLIRSRVRTIQRQIAYKRMMHEVPKSDVVVTNPTHVAVAIKYDVQKMSAPRVTAKGAELIAQRIKQIAGEHRIPIVEDKVLARTLYKSVDIGEEIPEKLFHAVAQLLAYIYRMKNTKTGYSLN